MVIIFFNIYLLKDECKIEPNRNLDNEFSKKKTVNLILNLVGIQVSGYLGTQWISIVAFCDISSSSKSSENVIPF